MDERLGIGRLANAIQGGRGQRSPGTGGQGRRQRALELASSTAQENGVAETALEELDLDQPSEDAGAILRAGAVSLTSDRPAHERAAQTELQEPRRR